MTGQNLIYPTSHIRSFNESSKAINWTGISTVGAPCQNYLRGHIRIQCSKQICYFKSRHKVLGSTHQYFLKFVAWLNYTALLPIILGSAFDLCLFYSCNVVRLSHWNKRLLDLTWLDVWWRWHQWHYVSKLQWRSQEIFPGEGANPEGLPLSPFLNFPPFPLPLPSRGVWSRTRDRIEFGAL